MEEIKPQIRPIDVSALRKGDYISANRISRISGKPIDSPEHQLAVLTIKNKIEEQWPDYHNGETVWAKSEGVPAGIRILKDSEGVLYGNRRMKSFFRGIKKTTDTYINMNISELDNEALQLREKNINLGTIVTGRIRSALKEAQRRQLTEPDIEE